MTHRRAPLKSREAVEIVSLWAAWFNRHRLLEPIRYNPPAEVGVNDYRQLAKMAKVSACT